MRNKRRRWEHVSDDDPLSGLVNLVDVWMVFAIAVVLALVGASQVSQKPSSSAAVDQNLPDVEQTTLDHFRISTEKLSGEGQRLGTAYRLASGEVVYVPD